MASDENKFDSGVGRVVVPILHAGEGTVHDVEVPANTPLPEFHDALLDAGYHGSNPPYLGPSVDSHNRPAPKPTKEGVYENSLEFKKIAKAVFDASGQGRNPNEAGTYIDANGERGPISVSNTDGRMSLQIPSDAKSSIHSHPAHFQGATASPLPSQKDIDTAKKVSKKPVYVVSPEGLAVVESDGKVTSIYNTKDWFDRNNK